MLIISVLERNTLRSTTYGSVNASLEETIQTVSELTRELRLSGEISALGEGQAMLRTFESRAIELMRSDRWEEARKVLFDDDYVLAKKIYEINSETAISMPVTGVRSSCEARSTNSLRTRSKARCSVTSRSTITAHISRPSLWLTPDRL